MHRGPDQQGVFDSADVSLGAVRLKIIDLSPLGNQPMHSEDGDKVIVFNGEIYNHHEIRAELEALGHTFKSHCDTEVVLRAFLQWDTQALQRLRGMFGLAIWTESSKRLILARDRMGIKPLYYHRAGQDLYFGSELKAILVHPEIERRINMDGLNCYLRLNWVPAPHTLIAGIDKLPPGHVLEWRNGKISIEQYWKTKTDSQKDWTLQSAKEELDSLLQKSVAEHMVSDVPLGIWASGGIDSSTILHYATQATSNKLKTFSITFRGRSFDESSYIHEVAKHYNTEHTEFDLSTDIDVRSAIEQFPYYSDEPSADAGALPVWFLAQMSRKHVTVALSGEGADELFGGYLTYLADDYAATARRVPAGLRSAALSAMQLWPVSDDKISFEYKVKRFLQGSLLGPEDAHIYWNGTFAESEKEELLSGASDGPMSQVLATMGNRNGNGRGLNRYMFFDQQYYLPDDILYKVDRMSMAHSLEVRPPFLDHRIVEFGASLPEDLKIHGSQLKYILRQLMSDKLPASILHRPKVGFDIPVHDWFRGVLKPLLLDTLTEQSVRDSKIFRWSAVESLINTHLERRANLGYQLWGLVTLFLWIKRWNIQTGPSGQQSASTQDKTRSSVPILT